MAERDKPTFLRTLILATILLVLVAVVLVQRQAALPQPKAHSLVSLLQDQYRPKQLAEAPDLSSPASLRRPQVRLVPDRRFTGALKRIHAFYHPSSPVTPVVEYRGDGWDVTVGEVSLRWPEPVDFGDYLSAADELIAALDAKAPIEFAQSSVDDVILAEWDKRLGAGHLVPMIDILQEAEAFWADGKRDPRLLIYAAEIAGRMMDEADDALGMADPLSSYALFLTALERHFRAFNGTNRRELRLAEEMGYAEHALSRSDELEENDPLFAFVTNDFRVKKRELPFPAATNYERFIYERLRLERLGEDTSPLFARTLSSRPFDQAITGQLTALSWWGTVQEAAPMQAALTGVSLTMLMEPSEVATAFRAAHQSGSVDADKLKEHAEELNRLGKKFANPFGPEVWGLLHRFEQQPAGVLIDYSAIGELYRTYLLSSIYRVGAHMRKTLGSVEATEEYLQAVPEGLDEELSDYRRWYSTMYDLLRNQKNAQALLTACLREPGTMGTDLVEKVYKELGSFLGQLRPETHEAYRAMLNVYDGRPSHRSEVAIMARYNMLDPFRELEELEALDKLVGDAYTASAARYAVRLRDAQRIRELADNPTLKTSTRIDVLRELSHVEGWTSDEFGEFLLDESRRLRDFAYLDEAWTQFWKTRNVQRIAETGRRFITGQPVESVAAANTVAEIAAALWLSGDVDEAWRAIEPVIPVYNAMSLVWASRILDARGESERAREIAEAAIERYPYSMSPRMTLAEWHWKRRDWAAAARAITEPSMRVEEWDWAGDLSRPILRIFGDDRNDEVRAAIKAMMEAGVPTIPIASAAKRLGRDGHTGLACAILRELDEAGGDAKWLIPDVYTYIKLVEGEDAAREWWSQVPVKQHILASYLFHRHGLHEELWTLFPAEYQEQDVYHAVLQAVGCASIPELDAKYGEELRDRLSGGDDWYRALGRFILGDEEAEVIAEHMKQPKKLCEAAYFLGVTAENEGRISDAVQWYLVCTDTGLTRNGEFTWATDRLRAFKNELVAPEIAEMQRSAKQDSGEAV